MRITSLRTDSKLWTLYQNKYDTVSKPIRTWNVSDENQCSSHYFQGYKNQFFCAICVSHWKWLIHELYITWQSHLPPMRAGTTNATGWPLGLEAAKARDCPKPESIVARFGEGMKSTSTRKTYSAHCVIWVDGQIQILIQITCNSQFYIKTSLIQITDKTLIWYEMRWDAYAKVSAVKNCFTVGPSNTLYPNMTLNLSTLMWL